MTNSCNKKNNYEYFHGYCDILQYLKIIEKHKNEINCLVNMDDTKLVKYINNTFLSLE